MRMFVNHVGETLRKPNDGEQGFTLIELSVVLVIMGLIVGGVLVAQDLISVARVNKVITEETQFSEQAHLFQFRFNALPGDFSNAQAMFTGCTNNGNNQCNGDGNGHIGEAYAPYYGEACRVWEHLKLAGWLANQNLVYVNQNAGACYPSEAPTSSYNSAASWYYAQCVATGSDLPTCTAGSGYFVLMTGYTFANDMTAGGSPSAIISPANARAIDLKIDDGNPLTGRVIAGNDHNQGLDSAPYAPQNRYCLYNATNPYASPPDYPSWSYYTGYSSDLYGCVLGIKTDF